MPFSPKPRTTSSTRPCGLSRSQRIALGGMEFIPDLSGALLAPDYKALLVADLHLEKGTSLARRGVHLPPYDTRESLLQLSAVLAWHDRAGRHGREAVRAAVDERPDDPVETDHDPRLAEEQHAERFVPEFVGRGHDVPVVSELRGGVGEEHGGIVPTRRRRCVSCA